MKKRFLTLSLALCLLLSLLAGCGGAAQTTETPAEASATEAPAETPAPEAPPEAPAPEAPEQPAPEPPADAPEAPAEDVAQPADGYDFTAHKEFIKTLHTAVPVTDEDVTLKYWLAFEAATLTYIENSDLNNHHIFANMKETTGVDVEVIMNDRSTAQEKFNIMIASGEYPDLLPASMYTTGVVSAYEDDVIIDLTELVPQYAPNYESLISYYDTDRDSVTADNGMLLNFYVVKDEVCTPNNRGAFVRMDWLEDLGLDVPKTYDQLYDVLTAFKNEKGATEPLMLYNTITPGGGCLIGGFGVNAVLTANEMGSSAIDGYYQVDGEVVYGATQDGTKEFLKTMKKYYADGLITETMLTREANPFADITAGYCANGVVGYFYNNQPFGGVYGGMSQDPNINFWPVQDVAEEEGQEIPFFEEVSVIGDPSIAITTACEHPEVAVAWSDYWYSYEGYLLANYGIEGEHWNYDDEGVPQYIPEVINQYESVNLAFCTFTSQDLPYIKADDRLAFSFSDRENACFDAWATNKSNACDIGSKCAFNTEESEQAASIYNDILTYVSECSFKFINGDMDIDAEWDTYVDTIESMNIQRVTELVQGAYDRAYGD